VDLPGLTPEDQAVGCIPDLLLAPIHVARAACGERDSGLFASLEHPQSGNPQGKEQQDARPRRGLVFDQQESQ